MTNTVFSMFQTQYILDFLSACRSSGTLGFSKHWDFQSKDVASILDMQLLVLNASEFFLTVFEPWSWRSGKGGGWLFCCPPNSGAKQATLQSQREKILSEQFYPRLIRTLSQKDYIIRTILSSLHTYTVPKNSWKNFWKKFSVRKYYPHFVCTLSQK
jgi:hypothetical protein